MDDPLVSLSRILSEVILPNLKSVQLSQAEQIAANDRLEQSVEELRLHLESCFAHLNAQLIACRAELAATQALLKAATMHSGVSSVDRRLLVH